MIRPMSSGLSKKDRLWKWKAYVREVGIYTGEYFALPGKFDVHVCRVGYV